MKHLTLFETSEAYNAATLDLPNVSLIEENTSVSFNPYVEPFFCKLTLNDGSIVELEGSGELTPTMTSTYSATVVSAEIGKSCTIIGNHAFVNCTGLTSVIIPDNITRIGDGAFHGSGLTSIDIPDSVTSIGSGAFNTDALKVLNYNAKCELSTSFRGSWLNLETVIIGDSTPTIGNSAFQGCTGLTSVIIGSSVTNIGNNAFYNCAVLSSITVNAITPPTLGSDTFTNNASGRKIYVPSESVETYKAAEGWSAYADRIQAIQ